MVMTETAPVTALEPKAKLTGKIIKITLAGAVVDVGQAVPGVLHISQLQNNPVNKVEDMLREGQNVEVWVRRVRKDRIELTMIEPLRYDWKDLQPEMVVKGKVVRLETYGAFVDIGAERPGMIHISELARGYVKTAAEVVKEGDDLEAMILSVDVKKRQIRLSLKALQPEVTAQLTGGNNYEHAAMWAVEYYQPQYLVLFPGDFPQLEQEYVAFRCNLKATFLGHNNSLNKELAVFECQ